MGFFRYFDTFNDQVLKGQIEDKKYFLEWGSNLETIIVQKYNNISFVFWFK